MPNSTNPPRPPRSLWDRLCDCGKTLWSYITGANKPVPESVVEDQYANPAKIRINGIVSLNTIDYSNLVFTVLDLWQWTRIINGKKRIITDYRILATPHNGGEPISLLLRAIPRERPDVANKFTHHYVVLKKFFECGYNDTDERNGILEAVNDPNGELVWQRDTPDEAKFWRIHSKTAYDCDVVIIFDENGDGKVDESEVSHRKYKLWDFHRNTEDEANQPMTEYLFVHQDVESGDFEAWRGEEIDQSRIKT